MKSENVRNDVIPMVTRYQTLKADLIKTARDQKLENFGGSSVATQIDNILTTGGRDGAYADY